MTITDYAKANLENERCNTSNYLPVVIEDILISEKEIVKIANHLNTSKSSGTDKIGNVIFKKMWRCAICATCYII